MNAPVIEAQGERTTTEMIKLARCSKLHRIIIAGERAAQQMFDLHRLGYNRVTTTRTCGHPREQYDVAFVDWHQRSVKLLSTTLDWLVCFLAPTGVMVLSIDCADAGDHRKLRSMLKKLGFSVEAGTLSPHGLTLSARRVDAKRPRIAA